MSAPLSNASGTGFGQPRPILVLTDDDGLAAASLAALDQLAWPAQRTRTVAEALALAASSGATFAWELILCDARLQQGRGQLPLPLRAGPGADTPWLLMARTEDAARAWPARLGAGDRRDGDDTVIELRPGRVLRPEEASPAALAELIATALEQEAEGRLLSSARALVAGAGTGDGTRPPLALPPALAAAHRLDWMYRHAPSLEDAAQVVAQQENLAKQVLRLDHALSGGSSARAWTLPRVLLDLGLQRFIPLVKIVAARSLFPARDAARAQSLLTIWRAGVARALAMRALATRSHPHPTIVRVDLDWNHAFDAGLFADTGASLLIWLQDQSQPRRPRFPALNALPAGLGACHEWLGERLLERWKQPRAVGVVAGGHHGNGQHLEAGQDPGGIRALALAAAAVLAEAAVGPDATGPIDHAEACLMLDRLRVDRASLGHVAALVRVELACIEEALAS